MTLHHLHDPIHLPQARRERAQHWMKTLLLLGLGVYFAALIVTGSLNNYINIRFVWLAYVAAVLFFLLGAYSLYDLLRPGHPHHDHAHGGLSWGILTLGLPLVLGTLIPSQPLGVEAVGGSISTTAVSAVNATTFTVAPEFRNVLDWLRVFSSTADFTTLEGEPADVIGFVYTEPAMPADEFMAARFTLSCCVADASAIGLPVIWQDTASLAPGEWVRVKGVIDIDEANGETRPVLRATAVEAVPQPEHPYLYP